VAGDGSEVGSVDAGSGTSGSIDKPWLAAYSEKHAEFLGISANADSVSWMALGGSALHAKPPAGAA
tara:strand:+ start:129 stop:326 length:198 start_codon:yes stop_codon:yes gene_type:complete